MEKGVLHTHRDKYSKEITNIFQVMIDGFPVNAVSVFYFLSSALYNPDTFMYRALNIFVPSYSIETIRETLVKIASNEPYVMSAFRIGGMINPTRELGKYIDLAVAEMEHMGVPSLTSDMVLLAILSDTEYVRKNLSVLTKNSINFNSMSDAVRQLHDIVDKPQDTDKKDKKEILSDVFKKSGRKKGSGIRQKNILACVNLNTWVRDNCDGMTVMRDDIISKINHTLSKHDNRNVFLVGDDGVGKTTLINSIVQMVNAGAAFGGMEYAAFYKLNINSLIAGTTLRGMFEAKLDNVLNDLNDIHDSVLVIDDAENIINSGKREQDIDIMTPLKMRMDSRMNTKIIMISSEKGYTKIINSDNTLERLFKKINVPPTTDDETMRILKAKSEEYGGFHHVTYSENALKECITLSKKYVTTMPLPLAPITMMDEAGAMKKSSSANKTNLSAMQDDIDKMEKDKLNQLLKDNMDEVYKINAAILACKADITSIKDNDSTQMLDIDENDIRRTVSAFTGIPVEKVSKSERTTLLELEGTLAKSVIGQDEAIKSVSDAVRRNKIGLRDVNKPIYSALFVGGTGTGKTLTSKILAREIFGSEGMIVRFDMSEYSDKTAVNKLIGTGAGYVGYENGGLLTDAIRNKPYSVVLFDEIEKADEQVYNLLLQVLDEGFLTDNKGNRINFRNTIVILTSNVGVKDAKSASSIGFSCISDDEYRKDIIEKGMKDKFPPEFLNRLDDIVYFNNLTDANIKDIIRIGLDSLCERCSSNINVTAEYDECVIDYVFDGIGGEREYGARPVNRFIQHEIEKAITDFILTNEDAASVGISVENGKIKVS